MGRFTERKERRGARESPENEHVRHARQRRLLSTPFVEMATASDRFNINSQLEHLQTKYVGTGHPDLHRYDWFTNIKRDTYASLVGHHNMVTYVALCENESIGRSKYTMLQNMFLPCG